MDVNITLDDRMVRRGSPVFFTRLLPKDAAWTYVDGAYWVSDALVKQFARRIRRRIARAGDRQNAVSVPEIGRQEAFRLLLNLSGQWT